MDRRELVKGCFATFAFGYASSASSQLHLTISPQPQCTTPNNVQCPLPDVWSSDHRWNLQVDRVAVATGPERKKIRISGDKLVVSKSEMPSITREMDSPAGNVSSITFDGRHIEVAGSIAFQSGEVRLFAGEISFHPAGLLTLYGDRSNDGSALIVVAQTLNLGTDPYLKPINIYYGVSSRGPRIRVYVEQVLRAGVPVGIKEGTEAIWQMIAASDELDQPPADVVEIVVGPDAAISSAALWEKDIIWPAETYSKALRLHSAKPFDRDIKKAIDLVALQVGKIIDRTSLTQVATGLPAIAARAANNLDAFSHGPNWAPRKSLTQQIDDFEKSIGAFADNQSTMADDLIAIMAAGYADAIVPEDRLAKLKHRQQQIRIEAADIDALISSNIDGSRQLKIDFETLKISMTNAKERIQRSSLDEQKKLNDAATARQGFAIAGTVAGIATSFFVGPVAGAGVATGLQTAGNIIYAHNTSGINPKSLGEIIEQGAQFYQGMTVVFENWDKFRQKKDLYFKVRSGGQVLRGDAPAAGQPDNRKPYTETQAAQEVGTTLGDFGKSFGAVVSGLKAAAPQPLSLSEKEKLDPELQELLERLAANQKRQSELLADLQALTDKKTAAEAELNQTKDAIETLLALAPTNDYEKRLWIELARYIWISEIRTIVQQIYVMRRAFFFETGTEIPLRSDLAEFPSSLISLVDAGSVDILSPGVIVTSDDVRTHLIEQKRQLVTSARAVRRAVQVGLDAYLSRNTRKVSFQRAVEFRVNDQDPNKRAFVAAINAQIALLIARGRGGYVFTHVTEPPLPSTVFGSPASDEAKRRYPDLIPLYIPFLLRSSLSTSQAPLRFVQAQVISVTWQDARTNLDDDGIDFTVIHPGYGEVAGNGLKRSFDLREGSAINEVSFRTTAYMLKSRAGLTSREVQNVIGERYYTYYPARTDYYLAAEVTSLNWARLPQVKEIVIAWELFQ